jgi:hypothetical protein
MRSPLTASTGFKKKKKEKLNLDFNFKCRLTSKRQQQQQANNARQIRPRHLTALPFLIWFNYKKLETTITSGQKLSFHSRCVCFLSARRTRKRSEKILLVGNNKFDSNHKLLPRTRKQIVRLCFKRLQK